MAQRPNPMVLRFEEDWSVLSDSLSRTSPLDNLKYIPLGTKGSYLSLGADVRGLFEWLENSRNPSNGYYLSRLHLHADMHFANGLRVFVQPASALEYGDDVARAIDRDALYLLNAFVDVPLWRPNDQMRSLTARVGRFEMHYGDGRLITYRNPTNVRHYFEGVKLLYKSDKYSVDLFGVGFGQNRDGVFDNPILDNPEWTWGVYFRKALGAAKDDGPFGQIANDLAFFYLGHHDPRAEFFNASGRETRHTFGGHVDRKLNQWDYQFTLAGQTGQIGGQEIWAFGSSASISHTWTLRQGEIRIGGFADYWSGDRDNTDNRFNGFNPLYPRNSYYRGIAAPWSSNFYDVRPIGSLTLGNFNITTTSTWYWRASVEDGFYQGWGGNPVLAPQPPYTSYLGRQTEGSIRYGFSKNAYVMFVYSNFAPGAFVRANPQPSEIRHFVDLFVGWSF